MRAELLPIGDARWRNLLNQIPHDFYHLPGYVALEAKRLEGEAIGLLVGHSGGFALLPLVKRMLPPFLTGEGEELFDAVSPYGYPCPLFGGANGTDPRFQRLAVDELIGLMAGASICSAFVRLHPLLAKGSSLSPSGGTSIRHGSTVWLNLEHSEAELQAQMRKTTRNLTRRLHREGFTARMDNSAAGLVAFDEIYSGTMTRLEADESYFFGMDYLEGLREALGSQLNVCVVEYEHQVVAAGLFTEVCQGVQYHLSGTRGDYVPQSPTRLMLEFVRDWAKARGNKTFHLGGGLGGREDGLFKFKTGFSKDRCDFHTWRIISLPEHYERVSTEWERQSGQQVDPIDGYFPCYRRPFAS